MLQCFGQSECSCLHKIVNMVVFFVKSNENTYPKGRALVQMYRIVPMTKRVNYSSLIKLQLRNQEKCLLLAKSLLNKFPKHIE